MIRDKIDANVTHPWTNDPALTSCRKNTPRSAARNGIMAVGCPEPFGHAIPILNHPLAELYDDNHCDKQSAGNREYGPGPMAGRQVDLRPLRTTNAAGMRMRLNQNKPGGTSTCRGGFAR